MVYNLTDFAWILHAMAYSLEKIYSLQDMEDKDEKPEDKQGKLSPTSSSKIQIIFQLTNMVYGKAEGLERKASCKP